MEKNFNPLCFVGSIEKWMDEENGPSQFLNFEGYVSNFLCHLAIHLNGVY